jgi:hypothetical protein
VSGRLIDVLVGCLMCLLYRLTVNGFVLSSDILSWNDLVIVIVAVIVVTDCVA